MLRYSISVALWILTGLLVSVTGGDDATPSKIGQDELNFFENRIRPLLVENCYECHGPEMQESELRLDSRGAMLKGGEIGAAMVPGKPDESLLINAVRHGDIVQMPPKRKLSPSQIDDLAKWVEMGAPWPGERMTEPVGDSTETMFHITEADKAFWSFVPIQRQHPPEVRDLEWCRSDMDRFILSRLETHDLVPAPAADKYTWLRRVTFDLTGLPPTPSEVESFLDDSSPEAFETVVNRLLDSPRYGEQWGRHWLDVARFAEGAGHCSDWVYRLAWRYRDYVIEAFNNDQPYNEFIIEQLAGDLLPRSADANLNLKRVIATGFLHVGHKPLAERDKKQMMLEVVDEQVNTVGVAFMGLSIGCARCHDHKFDPIPTQDYYSLAGMFMSTQTVADRISDSMFLEYEMPDANGNPVLVMGVRDEKQPTVMRVHHRGSYKSLGELAPHRFLRVIAGEDQLPLNGSGRLELARWIASPENPLTARVMVNRIWQHHFGTGLVASSGDFGHRGEKPSHPELLDYLATQFVESGWSIKVMHRLMVLSSTYRQASVENEHAGQLDSDNRLLWRMNRRRLTAEEVRDGILAASGQLDLSTGGSMLLYRDGWGRPRQYPKEDGVYDRAIYGFRVRDKLYPPFERTRRSVYLPQIRSIQSEFMRLFDGPDLGGSTAKRNESTVAPQSLFFLNSDFVNEAAIALARELTIYSVNEGDEDGVRRAYLRLFGRPPDEIATARGVEFLRDYERQLRELQSEHSTVSEHRDLVSYDQLVQQTPGLISYYRLDELHEFQDPHRPHSAVNSAKPGSGDGRYLHHMKWKKPGGGYFDGFSFNDVGFGRWGALGLDTASGRRNTAVGFNMPYEWPFDDKSDTGVNRGHRVQVDDASRFNTTSGELSVEYWLKPIIAPWSGMVVGRDNGADQRLFRSGIQEATVDGGQLNVVYCEFFGDGNGGLRTGADNRFVVEAGQWNHVAFSFGGGKRCLYLNGNLVDEAPVTGTLLTGDVAFTIAARPDEQDWFAGIVDEVAVYDRTLSPETVRLRIAAASGDLERSAPLTPKLAAWAAYCKTLLSTNEFIFMD